MIFESETLFPAPAQHNIADPRFESMNVRDIEAQLAYELALERVAQEQGRVALFNLSADGSMHVPEEVQ